MFISCVRTETENAAIAIESEYRQLNFWYYLPLLVEALGLSCSFVNSLLNMRTKKNHHSPAKNPCVKVTKRLPFAVTDEVLACWQDGLYYLAVVKLIDETNSKCQVSFEDGSEYWISFKNIRTSPQDGDISCILCQREESKDHNEIIICDRCNHGYHQACHIPVIDDQCIKQPEMWFCRVCVFSNAAKSGGAIKSGPEADAMMSMKQVLPYDINSLEWDSNHKTNTSEIYCYCGGPGVWYYKMLECYGCKQWFHEACLQCLDYPLLLGDRFYYFLCALCNDGEEYLKRVPLKWSNLTMLVMYNLSLKYNKRTVNAVEIKRFLENNWDELQTGELHNTSLEERMKKVVEILGNKHKFRCNTSGRFVTWSVIVRCAPHPTKSVLHAQHMKRQFGAEYGLIDCNGNYLPGIQTNGRKSSQSDGRATYTRVYPRAAATDDVTEELTSPQIPLFPSPSMFKYFFPSSARRNLENGGNPFSSAFTSGLHGARQDSEDTSSPGEKRARVFQHDCDPDGPMGKRFFAKTEQLCDDITSYEGALGRLACGEACTIHGRRWSKDGRTEYLVEWSGTTPND